jgi:hypothetical protein
MVIVKVSSGISRRFRRRGRVEIKAKIFVRYRRRRPFSPRIVERGAAGETG